MIRLPTSGPRSVPPRRGARTLGPVALFLVAAVLAGAAAPSLADPADPPDNLELIVDTAALAVSQGLAGLQLQSDGGGAPAALRLDARGSHKANWVVEHLLLEELLGRGIDVVQDETQPHTLSFRIVELGIWATSTALRSSVKRRCRVSVSLRLEEAGELVWMNDATQTLTDRVSKRQIDALQTATYAFAKTEVEEQSWGKYVEPVIVSSVLGTLVYLFFSNR